MRLAVGLVFVLMFALLTTGSFVVNFSPSKLFASVIVADSGRLVERVRNDDGRREAIIFTGDIMLARDVERKLSVFGTEYPFKSIGELLQAKFVVGNFEASIPAVHKPTPDFGMVFSVLPHNLKALVNGGFTHLSLANNHALDHGVDGYQNTLKQLELYGFKAVGYPRNVSSSSVAYFEISGTKVALIAMNAVFGNLGNHVWSEEVETARSNSDLQIAYIHWGEEYKTSHNEQQESLARALSEAGVDLIVGHHPHVVQDIARYDNTLVFYSLGNLIFDQYFSDDVETGLIVELKQKNDGWVAVLHPVESQTARIQPRLMTGDSKDSFLETLAGRGNSDIYEEIMKGEIALQF